MTFDPDRDKPVRSRIEDASGEAKKEIARTGKTISPDISAIPTSVNGFDQVPTLENQIYRVSVRENINIHPISARFVG